MFIATKISPQDHAAIREHAHALGKADRLAGITRTPLELVDATVPCIARLQRHLAVDPHRSAALRVWGDVYREARSETITLPEFGCSSGYVTITPDEET
jgi:hypothetical protein